MTNSKDYDGRACPLQEEPPGIEEWIAQGRDPNEWMELHRERKAERGALEVLAILYRPEINENDGDLRYDLALAFLDMEKYEDAAKQLRESLGLERRKTTDYEVFCTMASTYHDWGKRQETAYARALALHEGRKTKVYRSRTDEGDDVMLLIDALENA